MCQLGLGTIHIFSGTDTSTWNSALVTNGTFFCTFPVKLITVVKVISNPVYPISLEHCYLEDFTLHTK